jgi:thymidylate kinase
MPSDPKVTVAGLLAAAPKRAVQIDGTLYLFVGADLGKKIETTIRRALNAGKTVTEKGTAQWFEDHTVIDRNLTGADVYMWSKDGNHVLCDRFHVTKLADGTLTKKFLRRLYLNAKEHT